MDGYRVAEEFILYNNIFNVLLIVVSFAISWLAFKVYRMTKQQRTATFSVAFLLLGVSFCLFFTPMLFHIFSEGPPHPSLWRPFFPLLFALLYLSGIILLFSSTLKSWQPTVPAAILLVSLVGLLFAPNPIIAMHIFSIIFFGFITAYYLRNYLRHREATRLAVLFGFVFLFLGNFILIFAGRDSLFFTLGRLVELAGYLAFLIDLWLVLRQ